MAAWAAEAAFYGRQESVILKKADGTAKYANHAKAERLGREHRFAQRVKLFVHSTPFPFAYLAYFAVRIAGLQQVPRPPRIT